MVLFISKGFAAEKDYQGLLGRDTNIAENAMIKIDTITNRILKNFKRSGNKVDKDKRKELLKKMNDILTDGNNLNPAIDDTGKVTLRSIDPDRVIDFSNDLINNYKADPKDVAELVQNFNDMRGTWSELFTLMGSRLTPAALEDFQKVIPKQINDVLDRGYEVFKNSPMSVADNYGPSSKVINKAVEDFIDEAAKKNVAIIARVPLASGLLTGKMTESSSFPANDHRNYNIKGEAFDVGETFSGVNFDKGLQAVEEIKKLIPNNFSLKSRIDCGELITITPFSSK